MAYPCSIQIKHPIPVLMMQSLSDNVDGSVYFCFYWGKSVQVTIAAMGLMQHRWQGSWGQHGVLLGPVGPRWAPCRPHEPCYPGTYVDALYHCYLNKLMDIMSGQIILMFQGSFYTCPQPMRGNVNIITSYHIGWSHASLWLAGRMQKMIADIHVQNWNPKKKINSMPSDTTTFSWLQDNGIFFVLNWICSMIASIMLS